MLLSKLSKAYNESKDSFFSCHFSTKLCHSALNSLTHWLFASLSLPAKCDKFRLVYLIFHLIKASQENSPGRQKSTNLTNKHN